MQQMTHQDTGGEPNKISNRSLLVFWWGLCCLSYSLLFWCLGGTRVANLISFTSGVLVGPLLLILFGSPLVFWWGPCCSSYLVHLWCLSGSRVAHLIRFTSGVLVWPVLLFLFASPPVSWWGLCCSSYSVHLRCFGGACDALPIVNRIR
jgi:hypothetical protein